MNPPLVNLESLVREWSEPPEDVSGEPLADDAETRHTQPPGELELVAVRDDQGGTRLERSRSRMPLALQRKIPPDSSGQPGRVCVLTPGGGHLGADRLNMNITCKQGSYLRLEDTGMKRIYGMKKGEDCRQTVSLTVESGGCLEWIPGPVIPYADSFYHERIQFNLHEDAALFLPLVLLPGRIAHGERGQFRYYGSRVIARGSPGPEAGSVPANLRFADSITLGSAVNSSLDCCLATIYFLLENDDRNPDVIQSLRESTGSNPDLRGGTSELADKRTLVTHAAADRWPDLLEFVRFCYRLFRKEMALPGDPSPFLFTAD